MARSYSDCVLLLILFLLLLFSLIYIRFLALRVEHRLAILRGHQLRRKHDLSSDGSIPRGRKRTSSISSERIAAGGSRRRSSPFVERRDRLRRRPARPAAPRFSCRSCRQFVALGRSWGRLPNQAALAELAESKHTLPSLGLIDEQTVAGATATGTHGSGRNSLSHYVQAV